MNIGLFTDAYVPSVNGVVTSVETLKKALEQKGHTVYIVTVGQDSKTYDYNEKERILSVTKENETYSYTQRYKLFVKLEKIEYVLYESPIETILYE